MNALKARSGLSQNAPSFVYLRVGFGGAITMGVCDTSLVGTGSPGGRLGAVVDPVGALGVATIIGGLVVGPAVPLLGPPGNTASITDAPIPSAESYRVGCAGGMIWSSLCPAGVPDAGYSAVGRGRGACGSAEICPPWPSENGGGGCAAGDATGRHK